MAARREKGLCYNCDEVYTTTHRCKHRHLFMLEAEDAPLHTSDEGIRTEPNLATPTDTPSDVAISLKALAGNSTFQTLKLQGTIHDQPITMLVDSGSTHNFLDSNTAKKLGCTPIATPSHSVASQEEGS
ncbi:hypothetical protein ACHQM5_017882 [Ranunculus cassubicifolius]